MVAAAYTNVRPSVFISLKAGENMKKIHIGILTWRKGTRFAEPGYFSRLVKEGEKLDCTVFLFSPQDVILPGKTPRLLLPEQFPECRLPAFAWQQNEASRSLHGLQTQ